MEAVPEGKPVEGPGRGLWDALAEEIDAAPTSARTNLWASLEDRLDFSRRKPCRAPQVEVAHQVAASGAEYYILHNTQANTYLKIDDQDYFLWQHLDGEHTVRDLAVAYFAVYKSFPLDRLVRLLDELKAKRLLDEKPIDALGGVAHRLEEPTLAYRLQHFADTSMQKEFNFRNVDGFFGPMYRRLAWPLFTRLGLIICVGVSIAGLVLFVRTLLAGTYPLLQTAGSYGLGLLVLLLASNVLTFVHESGHALTCKHYGRTVLKGGFLFYYGSPAFYVDTTDIWMAPRAARVATSFAGVATGLILGGVFLIVIALFPAMPLSPVLFQAAAMGYLLFFLNIAPFMELDGYYVLVDWLEIPLLRRKSLSFVLKRLPRKLLRMHTPFTREERIFSIYGLLTGAYTVFFVLSAIFLWRKYVRGLIEVVLSGEDILATVLVSWLVIIAGIPLILGLLAKAVLLISAGVARLREAVQH
jgi:putative peptide zinc metalloprotease protein